MGTPLSYIEISKDALLHNVHSFQKLLPEPTALAVAIKGNAYGHGQNEIASLLAGQVDYLQIDDLDELERLREVTDQPALVFGYVADAQLERAIELNGIVAAYSQHQVELLNRIASALNTVVSVHLKIDAQWGRMGILPDEVGSFCRTVRKLPNVNLVGIYSHFANIEDTTDLTHAEHQLAAYHQAVQAAAAEGYTQLITHISASSGILTIEQQHTNHGMARLGIGAYGMWPSEALRKQFQDTISLRPVLRWVSHVANVKRLPANHPIGYGLTYITPKDMTVAVIPQGYSDGYDRGLSNVGEVLIAGKRCRVLGRVAMNMLVVDVDHIGTIAVEDEVVLLGNQGDERITPEQLALQLGTINYEITTRISALLPRIVV